MKLSQRTLKILNSFSPINTCLLIEPSDNGENTHIMTSDEHSHMYADFIAEEVFEKEVLIGDLPKLLSFLKGYPEADIEFHDTYMVVKDNGVKCKIMYTNRANIVRPEGTRTTPNPIAAFDLKSSDLSRLLDASGTFYLYNIKIFSEEGRVKMQAWDKENVTKDTFDLDLGETNKDFSLSIAREKFNMMKDQDYKVQIFNKSELPAVAFVGNPDETYRYITVIEYEG